MPPHLHPRSTATSTLFVGTLVASFAVVAIPHLFPCPRPRKVYADHERQVDIDGKPLKKRRRSEAIRKDGEPPQFHPSTAKASDLEEEAALFRQFQAEAKILEKEGHQCPVPKPTGVLGRLLGFEDEDGRKKKPTKAAQLMARENW